MNPNTGAIAEFENEKDAKDAGHTVLVTEEEARWLKRFKGKNRKQRRTELARMRKMTKNKK